MDKIYSLHIRFSVLFYALVCRSARGNPANLIELMQASFYPRSVEPAIVPVKISHPRHRRPNKLARPLLKMRGTLAFVCVQGRADYASHIPK